MRDRSRWLAAAVVAIALGAVATLFFLVADGSLGTRKGWVPLRTPREARERPVAAGGNERALGVPPDPSGLGITAAPSDRGVGGASSSATPRSQPGVGAQAGSPAAGVDIVQAARLRQFARDRWLAALGLAPGPVASASEAVPFPLRAQRDPTAAALSGLVRDPLGRPLGDVLITLFLADVQGGIQRPPPGLGSRLPLETHSDSAGRFRFEELPLVDFQLTATHARFAPLYLAAVSPSTDASAVLDLKLPETSTLGGRVLDFQGRPLEGATVEAVFAMEGAGGIVNQVRTDAAGDFRLGVRADLRLRLNVSLDGYRPEHLGPVEAGRQDLEFRLFPLPPSGDPSKSGAKDAAQPVAPSDQARLEVLVSDGEGPLAGAAIHTGQAIGYSDEAGRAVLSVPTGKSMLQVGFPGYASDTREIFIDAPLASVSVALVRQKALGGILSLRGQSVGEGVAVQLWTKNGPRAGESRTDAQGAYLFLGLSAGEHFLVVPEYHHFPSPVTVQGDRPQRHDLALGPRTLLRGRITYVDGRPVANVTIHLHSADHHYYYGPGHYYTDVGGRYAIPRVPAGHQVLSIHKSDASASDQVTVPVAVQGEVEETHDIVLPELSQTIRGQVRRPGGRPAGPGIKVGAAFLDGPYREIISGWTDTDDQGRFVFVRMRKGRHLVRTAWSDRREGVAFSEILDLPADAAREIDLLAEPDTAFFIRGRVRCADGSPVSVAFCFAIDALGREAGNFFGTIDWTDKGGYSVGPLYPGEYRIRVTAQGCFYRDETVTLGAADMTRDLVLERHP